ncbi:DnaJ domain-containing protein [Alkalicaulis satelles]|uniref:DnaJ domain-containing protein n=1 Tax=Alkalicaulis satelles TaxID=2609175 RepID=A0A5M6Z8K3_9PROT|nr:DnaJ domain-containing protein [Alkalicaulis satelles]KAA5800969.1 DnaJ domain-containing protein [Alkalicaulis satelles]
MSLIMPLLAAALAVAFLAYAFSRMKTAQAAMMLRVLLGLVGVGAGVVLTVRGLAVAGIPVLAAGLGLLGASLRPGQGRAQGQGQDGASHEQTRRPSRRSTMTRREAAQILGVAENASADEIRQAHRELMKKLHPDAGGSGPLAAQVQEARDVLLGR